MRRLLLLRHAKAEPANGFADFDRPLSASGRLDSQTIGTFMAEHGLAPDLALISSARRTAETWNIVASNLSDSPPAQYDRLLYGTPDTTLLAAIRDVADKHRAVIVVGHNPGLEQLARAIAGSGSKRDLERLHQRFRPGALAVIDFATDHWRQISANNGRLAVFVSPADLAGAKK